MQNRYTGDIGDFSKLGILRFLQAAGLSIGLNWYLVPDENHNGDGRHVQYLQNDFYRALDEVLWLELKDIIESGQRAVSSLEKEKILKATYFSEVLDIAEKPRSERTTIRDAWHRKAVNALSGCDLICVDPDNGIIVPSAKGTARESKFVTPEELRDYYSQGSSIMYYQHKARRPDSFYLSQHRQIVDKISDGKASGLGLKFIKTSLRYYFFIIQPIHQEIVSGTIQRMMVSGWNSCFEKLEFEGEPS